jgi:hypothetical protein
VLGYCDAPIYGLRPRGMCSATHRRSAGHETAGEVSIDDASIVLEIVRRNDRVYDIADRFGEKQGQIANLRVGARMRPIEVD